MYHLNVVADHQCSKVQQIVDVLVHDIQTGQLKKEQKLPSINQFSEEYGVAQDTVEKAYKRHRKNGYIVSYPGRGYFVFDRSGTKKKVLLIFNEICSFKKIIYESLVENLGRKARIDLGFHHNDPNLLQEILEDNLGKYNNYVIMPYFFAGVDEGKCLEIIRMVPAHQLILLEKHLPLLTPSHKVVYQDYEKDIYEALFSSQSYLKKYNSLTLMLPEHVCALAEVAEGISTFCEAVKQPFYMTASVETESLRKGSVYIVLDDESLALVLKQTRERNWTLGRDISIISFNDTVW